MPPRPTPAEQRLVAAYHEAALKIARQLQQAASTTNRAVILHRIDSFLTELDQLTADWIQKELPMRFTDGSDEAIAQLRKVQGFGKIDDTFGTLHNEALRALADDAKLKFAGSLQSVRNEASKRLSQADKQKVLQKLIASEAAGENDPEAGVKRVFQDLGITAFRSANKTITLEDYAAMLTHTVLADAHNTGAATRYASNGVQYARRIERPECCEICRPMRDKIVYIGDARLLPPTHPWCYGGLVPVIGEPHEEPIMSPDDPRIPEKTRRYLLKRI